jgi:hypothetical protein
MEIRPRRTQILGSEPVDNFGDLYAIHSGSKHSEFDPDELTERLKTLTNYAHKLGFMSLLDAALADAQMHKTNKDSRERVLQFSAARGHEKLLSVFTECCTRDSNGRRMFDIPPAVETVYESEFDSLWKLRIMNKGSNTFDSEHFREFSFTTIYGEMARCASVLNIK